MPAGEETWYNLKRLHKIFAASAVALLIATVWTFVEDHNRPWKPYQRTFQRVELAMNRLRLDQIELEADVQRRQRLRRAWEMARSEAVDERLLTGFLREQEADARRLGASPRDSREAERLAAQLRQLAGRAERARAGGQDAGEAERRAAGARRTLLDWLDATIAGARFREDQTAQKRRFSNADLDAAKAQLDSALRDDESPQQLAQDRSVADRLQAELDELTVAYEDARRHREKLDSLLRQLTAGEREALAQLDSLRQARRELEEASRRRRSTYFVMHGGWLPWFGKKWLELPILDAFNSPRKIENLWSEGLEQDYNFRRVRRFDRCTTCHQAIQATAPGTVAEPGYVLEHEIRFVLDATREGEPDDSQDYERWFGLRLVPGGLLNSQDVTIGFVRSGSPAARARRAAAPAGAQSLRGDEIRRTLLQRELVGAGMGGANRTGGDATRPGLLLADVVEAVNGVQVADTRHAARLLQEAADAGAPVTMLVRRGLPHPYASHPRLDLFVGSLSPHGMERFACTVCHGGQGSATAFPWASHTPNDPEQRKRWRRQYGWFDNLHWDTPMLPRRFAQSACLRCHYDVADLAPTERIPDPPAPKLVRGDRLIRTYGCFGCHVISGVSSDGKRLGPDRRPEPNTFAVALDLEADPRFAKRTESQRAGIRELAEHPERDAARRRVLEMLEQDRADLAAPLAALLRGVEHPGDLRRVGPSLRRVAHKLDPATLYDWIRDPRGLRPSTRMPHIFGLWKHLEGPQRQIAQKYEPVEIRGVVAYLLQYSQPLAQAEPPAVVSQSSGPQRSAERADCIRRGRELFETRGCLACHTHRDFPDADAIRDPGVPVQGPDLSDLVDKLSAQRNPQGRPWLSTWIRTPTAYSSRTLMPGLRLEPIERVDELGRSVWTDPVDDLVEYLLSSSPGDWRPSQAAQRDPGAEDLAALDELAMMFLLNDGCDGREARRYLASGIPPGELSRLKAAEAELVVAGRGTTAAGESLSVQQKLVYVGRQTIARDGCFGCHDIPGFEGAKPIGPELSAWGRKDPSQLAFEHIVSYLKRAGGPDSVEGAPSPERPSAYYMEQIEAGHRIGFAYQKLTEPRSYDYQKTAWKRYTERLRMPQFALSVEQREAILTFVLGLVADPPSAAYIHHPDRHEAALIAGAQVLDKYNCGGCHLLAPERWRIAFPPGRFGPQATGQPPFPFLAPPPASRPLQASRETDRRGFRTAQLDGMPRLSGDGLPLLYDDYGDPIEEFPEETYDPSQLEFSFELWSPAVIDGQPYQPGEGPLSIPAGMIEQRRLSQGGYLAKYLLPRIVARRQESNPSVKGAEAWGWLPPPLTGQGRKTQPPWLHDYLLDPQPIRPAAVLQMPKFNLSEGEASALVDYFAAADGGKHPYSYDQRRSPSHLDDADARYGRRLQQALNLQNAPRGRRLEDAMKIVTDNNYCVRCHIVADFAPEGDDRIKAPDLSQVCRRLQPSYVRDWIAKPMAIRPYTAMPVNIPYDPADAEHRGGISQELYHGSSTEQLEALVDLLANYDRYAKQRSPVAPLVQPIGAADAAGGQGDGAPDQDAR